MLFINFSMYNPTIIYRKVYKHSLGFLNFFIIFLLSFAYIIRVCIIYLYFSNKLVFINFSIYKTTIIYRKVYKH